MAIRCPKAKSKNCTNRSCKQAPAGGERCERCRRQMKRAERVAAVEKIEGKRKPEDFFGYRNRNLLSCFAKKVGKEATRGERCGPCSRNASHAPRDPSRPHRQRRGIRFCNL